MKHSFLFLRIVFGVVFILSGGLKLIDPVGTSLVVKEYLHLVHFDFLSFAAIPLGMVLSILEFSLGVAVLMRIRMRVTATIGLILMIIFTIITTLLYIYDPIKSCGCFGKAMELTHQETLIKNIILLGCIIPIFIRRKSINHEASKLAQIIFVATYGVIATVVSIISLVRLPFVEFGDFAPGTDLAVKIGENEEMITFQTQFIYEKGGERRVFSIGDLPDSTWTYIETINSSEGDDRLFEFYVTDKYGAPIVEDLINKEIPIIAVSIYDFKEYFTPSRWSYLLDLRQNIASMGGEMWLLASSSVDEIISTVGYDPMEEINVGFVDYKTAITVHRSNGGYLYLNSGFIVDKWSRGGFSADDLDVLSEDYDIVMMRQVAKRQLTYILSIVVILLSILVVSKVSTQIATYRSKHTS